MAAPLGEAQEAGRERKGQQAEGLLASHPPRQVGALLEVLGMTEMHANQHAEAVAGEQLAGRHEDPERVVVSRLEAVLEMELQVALASLLLNQEL